MYNKNEHFCVWIMLFMFSLFKMVRFMFYVQLTCQLLCSVVAWSGTLWHTTFWVHLSHEVDPYDTPICCAQVSHEVDLYDIPIFVFSCRMKWTFTNFCLQLSHEMELYEIPILCSVTWSGPLWHANFCVQLSHEVDPYDIPMLVLSCHTMLTVIKYNSFSSFKCRMKTKWTHMTYQFVYLNVAS